MPRIPAMWTAVLALVLVAGCREPLDMGRSLTADPSRGYRLYKANCANTCHPDNAFDQKSVKSYEELAYVVRDYYEEVVGKGEHTYSQQDIFDMARYLNDKHYHFKRPSF